MLERRELTREMRFNKAYYNARWEIILEKNIQVYSDL